MDDYTKKVLLLSSGEISGGKDEKTSARLSSNFSSNCYFINSRLINPNLSRGARPHRFPIL